MPSDIRNFFKPFTVPKKRVPDNSTVEDEIVVIPAKVQQASRQHGDAPSRQEKRTPVLASPVGGKRGRNVQTASRLSRQSSTQSSALSSPPKSLLSRESSARSTPTRRTPKRSPQKRSLISSLDGAADEDDLMHSSPTLSTQRKMTAVAVPSPKPASTPEPTPTPTPALNMGAPASRAAASFSSLSTLSSVPMSSQTSSRRVMKGGLQAVTNSDSGSDSDEELEELESFMPRKRLRMTPPGRDAKSAIEIPDTVKPARQSARLSDKGSIKSGRSTPRLPPSPPRTVYKHSLLKMVKAHEKSEKQDARIAVAEAAVAEADNKKKDDQAAAAQHVDGKTMAEAMAVDSDEGTRIRQAMERTEAMQDEGHFSFFSDAAPRVENVPFPVDSLPDKRWAKILKEEKSRIQACLTGFAVDLAARRLLPKNVIRWFACQLAYEPREELCDAYVAIIQACPDGLDMVWSTLSTLRTFYHTTLGDKGYQSTPCDNLSSVPASGTPEDEQFHCVCGYADDDGSAVACDSCGKGQHTTCYYPQYDGKQLPKDLEHHCGDCRPRTVDKAAAQQRQKKRRANLPPPLTLRTHVEIRTSALRYVIPAVERCATLAGVEQVARATADFALASLDEQVKGNLTLRMTIMESIEALLARVPKKDLSKVCSAVKQHLFDDIDITLLLRCQIITALPATSVHAHELRRRLALSCITEESNDIANSSRPLASPDWANVLLDRLRTSPHFSISGESDYLLLLHLTTVLDIAIDAGFSDFAFLSLPPPKPVGPFGKLPGPPPEERKFNTQIDALTRQLRTTASRIRDAGATHLRRTEAKSALERLAVRLEHSVRTRPKPKKDVFGGGGGHGFAGQDSKAFLESFVKSAAKKDVLDAQHESNVEGKVTGQIDGQADDQLDVVDEAGTGQGGLVVISADMLSERAMSDAGGADEDDDAVGGAEQANADVQSASQETKGLWDGLGGAVRLR
ncbi:hypothetical protein LTR85_000349 [Meristemomyces frigidus]|nr:hypothetical protein LTR85_000349 [Meristemomyces frigidus]